jgi:hypothetical protein
MRDRALPITVAALASLALAAALVVRPGDRSLALDAYLLLLGGLALLLVVRAGSRAIPQAGPSELERPLRGRLREPVRVRELERLEREVVMSVQTAFDTYFRLRPTLREVADLRLDRRGVDLDMPGSRAEELLGEAAWRIVRPDLERPADHMAPGPSLPTVEAAVTALERL